MAPAEASDQASGPAPTVRDQAVETADADQDTVVVVAGDELNAWRRGFTPQAEIWNGRLAMLGLSLGIASLLLIRLLT
ncbi:MULTISPECIES: high light inducible protein [unclassified Synechococcus]|uniref:high light inducible protein n=1 Tax=unclassified Synechococcus TaxID=2626047 RepID=UPI0008FF5251|nr:high light inducible protein [Synechococcus sp. SynAce01]TWB96522.1 hypothetical protein FB106_101188 [Synechococcus sp. Ace-Pa]